MRINIIFSTQPTINKQPGDLNFNFHHFIYLLTHSTRFLPNDYIGIGNVFYELKISWLTDRDGYRTVCTSVGVYTTGPHHIPTLNRTHMANKTVFQTQKYVSCFNRQK